MNYHSELQNVDEDGYTQLNLSSRGIIRIPEVTKRVSLPSDASGLSSSCWRLIAVTLGILCLVILCIAVVLGTSAIWRSSSESSTLKNNNVPSRNKENNHQLTQSTLEESMFPTKSPTTTGSRHHSCPPDWIIYENSCYLLSTSQNTWERSKHQCSVLASKLLKIDSLSELASVDFNCNYL